MSARLAASLTTIVGLSMLAGWLSAFRNRAYLGWLGLAFMSVSGYLFALDHLRLAHQLKQPHAGASIAANAFLIVCLVAFLLSLLTAVQETLRRIREIKGSHRAAEEALLAMMQAAHEREKRGDQPRPPEQGPDDTSSPESPDA